MRNLRNLTFGVVAIAAAVSTGLALAAPPQAVRVQVFDQRGAPVRDAVVEVDSAAAAGGRIAFPWRMAMAQRNLAFVPGTLVVAKGSRVAFPNLDQVRHSIYSFSKPAKFTIDLYGRDQTRTQGFPITGTVALGCKIHDAMRGYIRVVDTPFAGKTDGNGVITLNGVPAGSARVIVWHPRLRAPGNETARPIAVAAGQTAQKFVVTLK
jgi:plastocyanin